MLALRTSSTTAQSPVFCSARPTLFPGPSGKKKETDRAFETAQQYADAQQARPCNENSTRTHAQATGNVYRAELKICNGVLAQHD